MKKDRRKGTWYEITHDSAGGFNPFKVFVFIGTGALILIWMASSVMAVMADLHQLPYQFNQTKEVLSSATDLGTGWIWPLYVIAGFDTWNRRKGAQAANGITNGDVKTKVDVQIKAEGT